METIDLHGMTREEAEETLKRRLLSAFEYGDRIVCIIHGQGQTQCSFSGSEVFCPAVAGRIGICPHLRGDRLSW